MGTPSGGLRVNFDALQEEGQFLLSPGLQIARKRASKAPQKCFKASLEKNGSGTAGYRANCVAQNVATKVFPGTFGDF
jgi:hypothetical protein